MISLCLLSYNRPEFIEEAIRTARETADYPLEIIVNDDGSPNIACQSLLFRLLHEGQISKLVMNPTGHNQGVGASIRAAFNVATGDILVKADQDLIFKEGWASALADVVSEPSVGFAGLFKYAHEPVDHRKTKMSDAAATGGTQFEIHTHICASLFGIRRELYERFGIQVWSDAFAEDTDLSEKLKRAGFFIALTSNDYVINRGFGVGPSTVNLGAGPGQTQPIHHGPLAYHLDAKPLPPAPVHPERPFKVGVVMPVGGSREQNVRNVLSDLDAQTVKPDTIVLVYDGVPKFDVGAHLIPILHVELPKHVPGLEQPRNVGVAHLVHEGPEVNHVWFLDSDVRIASDCLEQIEEAYYASDEDRVLICPYVFMEPGIVGIRPDQALDTYRTAAFSATPDQLFPEGDPQDGLNHGMACFSGNIVWPLAEFTRIGGFWNEIHHARCEDGEIGLRAVVNGVRMSYVRKARGYHQWHPVDPGARLKNERDVPMIDARHPWVKQADIHVTDEDGKRFEQVCPDCKQSINTLLWWDHRSKPCR